MNCEEILDLISGHIDQENTPEEEAKLQEHLASCPHCRELLDAFTQTDLSLAEKTTPPADLTARIMKAVRKENKQPYRRRFYASTAIAGLATAALLGVALFGNFDVRLPDQSQAEPTTVVGSAPEVTEAPDLTFSPGEDPGLADESRMAEDRPEVLTTHKDDAPEPTEDTNPALLPTITTDVAEFTEPEETTLPPSSTEPDEPTSRPDVQPSVNVYSTSGQDGPVEPTEPDPPVETTEPIPTETTETTPPDEPVEIDPSDEPGHQGGLYDPNSFDNPIEDDRYSFHLLDPSNLSPMTENSQTPVLVLWNVKADALPELKDLVPLPSRIISNSQTITGELYTHFQNVYTPTGVLNQRTGVGSVRNLLPNVVTYQVDLGTMLELLEAHMGSYEIALYFPETTQVYTHCVVQLVSMKTSITTSGLISR